MVCSTVTQALWFSTKDLVLIYTHDLTHPNSAAAQLAAECVHTRTSSTKRELQWVSASAAGHAWILPHQAPNGQVSIKAPGVPVLQKALCAQVFCGRIYSQLKVPVAVRSIAVSAASEDLPPIRAMHTHETVPLCSSPIWQHDRKALRCLKRCCWRACLLWRARGARRPRGALTANLSPCCSQK